MEEEIRILEDFIKYFEAEAISRKYSRNISITVGEDDIQVIENLIERNKELEETNKIINQEIDRLEKKEYLSEDKYLARIKELEEEVHEISISNEHKKQNWIHKTTLNSYIPKSKIREIVDECIPKGKNIITGEEEYQPNTNANSFLTQSILKLLKEGD